MDHYKAHGRRKAGTWGKPHKDLRTDANRATRALQRVEDARIAFIGADPLDVDDYDAKRKALADARKALKEWSI